MIIVFFIYIFNKNRKNTNCSFIKSLIKNNLNNKNEANNNQNRNSKITSFNIKNYLFHFMKDKINTFRVKKSFIIIINFIIIFCILLQKVNADTNIARLLYNSNLITIKIKQSGNHKIYYKGGNAEICSGVSYSPNSITINSDEPISDPVSDEYYFEHEDNTIILSWEDQITSCGCLFLDCYNITEVDLSQFDISNIENFSAMFAQCYSLTSIIFPNQKASNAKYLSWMFNGCILLNSIDLSIFDTSNL